MMKYTQKNIIEFVHSRMDELGLTSYALSKKSGVSESSISRWFAGKQNITLGAFLKILEALQVKLFIK